VGGLQGTFLVSGLAVLALVRRGRTAQASQAIGLGAAEAVPARTGQA
jgi:hypothetical protein